jgi:hypothetical protein
MTNLQCITYEENEFRHSMYNREVNLMVTEVRKDSKYVYASFGHIFRCW